MSLSVTTGKTGRKIYTFTVWIQGRRYVRSTHQGNREEAMRQEAEFRTKFHSGGLRAADPRTVATLESFSPRFLAFCVNEKGIRESTRKLYVRLLAQLTGSTALGTLPLSEIESAAFAVYVQERMKSPNQQGNYTSLRRERQVLVSLLRYAYEIGEIKMVPIIRAPGQGVQKRREFIPNEEMFRTFLASANDTLRDAAILSASCGLRPGEIVDLNTTEVVQVEDGFVITLLQSKSEQGKRPIHVSSENAAAAVRVLDYRSKNIPVGAAHGLLFGELTGARETKVTTLGHATRRLARKLGLPKEFVFYCLRHLYITRAGANTSPQQLRELARHADIKTTMIYFNPAESDRRQVAASVRLLVPETIQ